MTPAVNIDVDALLRGLNDYFTGIDSIKEKIEEMKTGGFTFGIVLACLQDGSRFIDKIVSDSEQIVDGSVKKEALKKFLDDVIKLPFLFDSVLNLDGKLIGALIDGYIHLMNTKHGKEWAKKIESVL